MVIQCPHCGTEYDVTHSEFGKYVKCEKCRQGFVVGQQAASKKGSTCDAKSSSREKPQGSGRLVLLKVLRFIYGFFAAIFVLVGMCFVLGSCGPAYIYGPEDLSEINSSLYGIRGILSIWFGIYLYRWLCCPDDR